MILSAKLTTRNVAAPILLPVETTGTKVCGNAIHADSATENAYAKPARRTATRDMSLNGEAGVTVFAIVAHQASARYARAPGIRL